MERKPIAESVNDYQISRGKEADLILKNTLLNEVLDRIEEQAMARLMDAQDKDKRDQAWHEAKAVQSLKAELKKVSDNGKFASRRKESK